MSGVNERGGYASGNVTINELAPPPEMFMRRAVKGTGVSETALPQYSGDDVTCAKCGFDRASTTYKRGYIPGRGIVDHNVACKTANTGERLCRECLRCGYHWDEATTEEARR